MLQWPLPYNLKELRSFLGLTGYYRKFIPGYAELARPLTDQMEKHQYVWNDEATVVFETLKQALARAPILAMPDFRKDLLWKQMLPTLGLGQCYSKKAIPSPIITRFWGRDRLKSIYEKEIMAIVLVVLK